MPTRATAALAAPRAASLGATRRPARALRPRIESRSTPRQVSLSYAGRHPASRRRVGSTTQGYIANASSLAGTGSTPKRCNRAAVPSAVA